ncbi:MAG TPA: sodium:proton exchanger, partial [Dehalococcoidia bacterium]
MAAGEREHDLGDDVSSLAPNGLFSREWFLLAAAFLAALPAPVLRLGEVTGAFHPDVPVWVEAVIFGIAIFAAATLLTWASEVAETEVSAGLALVVLALIAVLPEYAVDLVFAIRAPHVEECIDVAAQLPAGCEDPHPSHLAIANMTGGNRLLVGLAWPVVFFIFYMRTKTSVMPVQRSNSLGILFLGLATLYSFSIPIRGHLSLIDTGIMFGLFAAYLYIASRAPPDHEREFVGPAAVIGAMSRSNRRAVVLAIFAFAAAVIFAAAEPFADGLVETGESVGVDEFILVQWVAPLASESPEFILAGMLALRGRHDAGMTILISSKVNQWTLLVGSLPLAFSISGTTLSPLDFDARQSEEVFLTAGQSLFAVAILVSLSMSRWEAIVLAALFATQFVFTETSVRLAYAVVYCVLALAILTRDIPHFRP